MADSHGTIIFDEKAKNIFDTFVKMSSLEIEYVDPDLSWLKQLFGVL
jgi:hypothetical protein